LNHHFSPFLPSPLLSYVRHPHPQPAWIADEILFFAKCAILLGALPEELPVNWRSLFGWCFNFPIFFRPLKFYGGSRIIDFYYQQQTKSRVIIFN